MATTENLHTGDASKTKFSFTFPYLKQDDVEVYVYATNAWVKKTKTTHYTFANATTITFGSAPAAASSAEQALLGNNKNIKIKRNTSGDALAATFYPGSAIRAGDLNDNYTQNLYVTQEASNAVTNANTDSTAAVATADTAKATADDAADDVKRWIKDGDGSDTTGDEDDADFTARPLKPQGIPYAVAQAASAVSTSASANTTAGNAVTTANTASTNATAALNNSRESDGSGGYNSAISIANTASSNATSAVSTANTASTNATTAVNTANAADTIADTAKLATDRLVATTSNSGATWTLTGNNTNASTDPKGVGYAVTQAEAAVTTANNAAADVAAAVLYTTVANKAALEALTPSEDGYYQVSDSTGLANATWGTPTYTLSGIPGTFPSSALDGITTRVRFTVSDKTFAYRSYTVNDADNRYLAPGDLLDEDNMASNSATKVASQQSIKAYSDLKAPLASPTFTGTVAIPNIANVETAITAKAPLASPTFTGTVAIPNIANLETAVAANTAKVTNVTTNLSVTANGTSLTVASSDGTNATIPAVTTSAWGAMTDEDKTKLDGIATSATANVGDAVLASDQNWTGAQRGALTTVTAASTTAFDFNLGNNFYIDLAGADVTTINASNATAGQSGSIIIKGHGSNSLAGWNAVYKFSGGTAPTLTGDATKYDRIDYIIYDASNIHMVWSGNY